MPGWVFRVEVRHCVVLCVGCWLGDGEGDLGMRVGKRVLL